MTVIGNNSVFLAAIIDIVQSVVNLPTQLVLHLLDEVEAVIALVEVLTATTDNQVDVVGFRQLHSDILILTAMRHFGIEGGRRGVCDITCHNDACLLALFMQCLKYRLHWNGIGIHA